MPNKYPYTINFPPDARLMGAVIGQKTVVVELFADTPEEAAGKAAVYVERVNNLLVSTTPVTISAGGVS